jgi:hypothetical protein
MWDIFQEIQLNDLRSQQHSTDISQRRTDGDVNELARQVRKIALVNQALYELLKERTGISDEELRRKIDEIDKRDGALDGKLTPKPVVCPKCGHVVTAGALSCQSCGAKVAPKYPFSS